MPTPTALLSPADQVRRRALRRMKAVALGALVAMAVLFVVAFWLQGSIPAMAYVRAAAEGGMVGALADWFAVTALFRRPLGLPIPHTAIIPTRKDEIGRSLGEFVETNFLSTEVVRDKLGRAGIAHRVGEWLRADAGNGRDNADRAVAEASTFTAGVLRSLSDEDVQSLLGDLMREHVLGPEWGPHLGGWLEGILQAEAHQEAVELVADSVATWLTANAGAFQGLVSGRLPGWVPRIAQRLVDDTVHQEAVKFVRAVQSDQEHPARKALNGYLARLADRLQNDPEMQAQLESAKSNVFDSPRVSALATQSWEAAKSALLVALADPESALRRRAAAMLRDAGDRLRTDVRLQGRVDGWIIDAAVFLVDRYRHDIASLITDTVERWDPAETTEKIELMVGKDLQYIRLNGTVVGALAGLSIFSLAHALIPV